MHKFAIAILFFSLSVYPFNMMRMGAALSYPQIVSLNIGLVDNEVHLLIPLMANVGLAGTKLKIGLERGEFSTGFFIGEGISAAIYAPYLPVTGYVPGNLYYGLELEAIGALCISAGLFLENGKIGNGLHFSVNLGFDFGDYLPQSARP